MCLRQGQQGATLLATLMMLTVVLLLGTAAAHMALQGEKSARNDRDRQVAFHAAEAALLDAERDIEGGAGALSSRAHVFESAALDEWAQLPFGSCGTKAEPALLGICRAVSEQDVPVWQHVNFLSDGEQMAAVPYGHFTGQTFQAGVGVLPALPPRYLIEFMHDKQAGMDAARSAYLFRITAIGFGVRASTQVVLQTFHRKSAMR